MRKVGILGGTFDPIHIGHTEIAREALLQYGLSEVRFMTGGNPPHKKDLVITDARVRHKMVELAVKSDKCFIADDFEVEKTEYSYTANTLMELVQEHPDWEIYFIIGEDSLSDLTKWYNPQVVTDNCILLVYPRDNSSDLASLIAERKAQFNADIRPINASLVNVSSTEIRSRIKNNESVCGLLDEAVYEFIKEKRLYK